MITTKDKDTLRRLIEIREEFEKYELSFDADVKDYDFVEKWLIENYNITDAELLEMLISFI